MKLAYHTQEPDVMAKTLAIQIKDLIVSSGVTYAQADAALTEAQRLLYDKTRPVSIGTPRQDDSESNP